MIARLTIALCLLLGTVDSAQAGRMYWRSALTGGGSGALDAISEAAAIPGVPLATGDGAVVLGSQVYYYAFDAVSQAPESSPSVIAPDDAGATGRWIRVPSFLQAGDVSGLAVVALSGAYDDLTGRPTIPNLSAPGPIGGTTPSTGTFTSLTATSASAQTLELGPQPAGTTGELSLPEDPANPGGNTAGWKAPASIPTTVKWVLPSQDGSAGQFLTTNGAASTSWSGLAAPGPIGTNTPDDVHAVTVVADSVITNPGPSGTTDTITLREDAASAGGNWFAFKADPSISADTTVLVPSQLPSYTATCPAAVTDACAAGQQCYSSSYLYLCIAANSWRRTALAAW